MARKKVVMDEHESMEAIQQIRKISILSIVLFITVCLFGIYILFINIKENKERKKFDEIVANIQNEIFLKQCHLNKIYCCAYKDKQSCKKWEQDSCSEADGSLKIDCKDIKK